MHDKDKEKDNKTTNVATIVRPEINKIKSRIFLLTDETCQDEKKKKTRKI